MNIIIFKWVDTWAKSLSESNYLNLSSSIKLDDGGITFSENFMEPVILSFKPTKTRYVKIEVEKLGDAENFGLAEMMFFR